TGDTDSSGDTDSTGDTDSSGDTDSTGDADSNGDTDSSDDADGNGDTDSSDDADGSGDTDTSGDTDSTDDAGQTQDSVVYVEDVDAWTTHGDPVIDESTGTDTQVLHVELTFSEAVSIADSDALIAEMALTLGSAGIPTPSDVSLSSDGMTLSITVEGWYAAYSGYFEVSDTWDNLVAVSGASVDSTTGFYVPNGVTTSIVEQVIADEDQNASVTTQIITDENCTRSMVHLLLLVNGQPVQLTGYGATATGHYHNYLTLTSAEFASLTAGYLTNKIGGDDGDYTVTYEEDSDEVTITAKSSNPGDILELHVMSYLNDGTKTIETSALDAEIAKDSGIAAEDYSETKYAAYADALAKAKLAVSDTTWYSQTDIDTLTEQLAAAIAALSAEDTDDEEDADTDQSSQNSSAAATASADTLVVRRGNTYYFSYSLKSGEDDKVIAYGKSTDEVMVGDWEGVGVDTLCVRRGNTYYFSNSLKGGEADIVIAYGKSTDEVLVGDWDGDGKDTLAVRRGNTYYFSNSLKSGEADSVIAYGKATDTVLVGKWDGNASGSASVKDTLAVRRGNTYYFNYSLKAGNADKVVAYGKAADEVLVGDWNGSGRDTLTVRRGNMYYISNSIKGGEADSVIAYGKATDEVYAGTWK
ncbi:MAG: MSCRAMM family adhesin SdrC, partial [Clostridiales bacterium]|nr:MSCRAMM family adhesin SdrC [Clostridiales bacterium]